MDRNMRSEFMRRAAAACVSLAFLPCAACGPNSLGKPDETSADGGLFVTAAEICIGGQFSAGENAEDVFWTSSDESVASVSDGRVTGLKAGQTTVTASDGQTMRKCAVTVRAEELDLKVGTGSATLAVGDKLTFSDDFSAGPVQWTSSDEAVAAVSDGEVTARGAGTAEIAATAEGFSAAYALTVLGGDERLLIWADEFDGDALDLSKWSFQTGVRDAYVNEGKTSLGPMFWGNNELQSYTEDAVSLAEGVMTVTAERKEGLSDERQFTSARILTRDKAFWTYGYFETRMKLPAEAGMWPAFWMLPQPEKGMGTNNRYGGWAANGEIDIMEAKGRLPYEVGNTLHFHGDPSTYSARTARLLSPISEWHTYGLEWRSGHISWFVDGEETYRLENSQWDTTSPLGQGNASAPFDVPFYIIIDLAVGGNYDGGVRPAESFSSASMQVDYVRVYA